MIYLRDPDDEPCYIEAVKVYHANVVIRDLYGRVYDREVRVGDKYVAVLADGRELELHYHKHRYIKARKGYVILTTIGEAAMLKCDCIRLHPVAFCSPGYGDAYVSNTRAPFISEEAKDIEEEVEKEGFGHGLFILDLQEITKAEFNKAQRMKCEIRTPLGFVRIENNGWSNKRMFVAYIQLNGIYMREHHMGYSSHYTLEEFASYIPRKLEYKLVFDKPKPPEKEETEDAVVVSISKGRKKKAA